MRSIAFVCIAVVASGACAPQSVDISVTDGRLDVGGDTRTDVGGRGGGSGGTGGGGTGGSTGGVGGTGGTGGVAGSGGSSVDVGAPDLPVDQSPPPDMAVDLPPDMPVVPDAMVDAPVPRTVLFVVGATNLSTGDAQTRTTLVGRGLTVRVADDDAAPDVAGVSLVVLSSSCAAATLAGKYRTVTQPVLVFESAVFDNMGMTSGDANNFDELANATQLTIALAAHPLAAGLTGNVTVVTAPSGVHWGVPAAAAEKVASLVGMGTRFAIFAYPKDAAMVGGFVAPAKRVGFFLSDTASERLSPDGLKLLNAAIDWSLQ
jgi:hypothetical protein